MKKFLSISVFVGLCLTLWAQTPAEQIMNRINRVFRQCCRHTRRWCDSWNK